MRTLIVLIMFVMSPTIAFSEVIRDYYAEPGLHAFKDDLNQNANEFIDPFRGALSLKHTDLVVPGNGGLDIVINRIYNSRQDADGIGTRTSTGIGWTIHFGRVIVSETKSAQMCTLNGSNATMTDNPSLELPDGSRQIFLYSTNQPRAYLVTKNNWKAECLGTSSSPNGLLVTSPNGTQYVMDQYEFNGTDGLSSATVSYYTSKITDRNGNVLNINYNSNQFTIRYIESVTSSDGRNVTFSYKNPNTDAVLLSSITSNSQTWTYTYASASTNPLYVNYKSLKRVTSPQSDFVWNYTYYSQSDTVAGDYSLKQVTYPTGGRILYTYDIVDFDNVANLGTTVVSKKRVYQGSTLSGTWSFLYQPSLLFSASNLFDKTTVTAPNGKYEYFHFGYNKATNGNLWRVGLLNEKKIYNASNSLIQSEVNVWQTQLISLQNYIQGRTKLDTETYAPYLKSQTITRNGNTYVSNYIGYDEFGNPQRIDESQGANTRSTSYTYIVDTTRWLLNITKDESISGLLGNITRTFDANGNLKIENKYGVITQYNYYPTGDVQQITDPNGQIITYFTSTPLGNASSYKRGIPQTENYPEAVQRTRVVSNAGTITSETDGRFKTTTFGYDKLNRLTNITYPKVGVSPVIVSRTATSKVVTRGLYNSTMSYDPFGRTVNTTTNGITVTNGYDVLGQNIFTSYPNKSIGTSTAYDVLGRVISISHPDSAQQFTYLVGNKSKIVNEKGSITINTYRSYGNPNEQILMNVAAPEGVTIVYARNKLEQIKSITQNGIQRSFGYNSKYYLTSMSDPEIGATSYGRDNVGNMTSKSVELSGATIYQYDNLH